MKTHCFLFVLLLTVSCGLSSCYTSYYYMVRHAEKEAAPADNPPLTAAGRQRAVALCDSLRDKDVTRIFVSQFLRTQQTAQPLAGLLNITPTTYNTGESVENLAAQLRATSGPNVLVVGHSNTIPDLIRLLTGAAVGQIPDNDFDNFFIVKRVRTLNSDRFTVFRAGTYGAPSP